jgi:TetR/AcrR family transcriptional regulator, transcriptional repressor of bet genes
MPRKPNTEVRRQQIVDGLLRTIAGQGYTGATIQAIASASGLAPGLVHYHFRDKREILVTLVEQLTAYASQRFQARATTSAGAEGRLRAYIDARLAYGSDANPDAVAAWVMIGAEAVRDPDVREVYQRAVRQEMSLIRKLLRAYLVESGRRVRKLDALAAALLAFVEGVFVLASNARAIVPTGFAADMAAEWIKRYVAAELPATDHRVEEGKSLKAGHSKGGRK